MAAAPDKTERPYYNISQAAEALGVSRTTATAAYAALRDEGYLASKRGSGSWTRLPADPGATPVVTSFR